MEVSVNNQTAVENPLDVVPVSQCDPEEDITLEPKKKKRKKRKTTAKKKLTEEELSAAARECPAVDILSGGGHVKSKEKKQSMISHFDYFLKLRGENIKTGAIEGRQITNYADITYDDLDKTKLAGEFASYLANVATKYQKKDGAPISYQTATGYMSSFKCSMIDHYHLQGMPHQFTQQIWSRMLAQIRHSKWEYARQHKLKLFGSKDAATGNDKMGLLAVCLWSGTLANAEFMNLFNAMVTNCGRGSEISITTFDQLTMKRIEEENMAPYATLQQFVHRVKTEGKYSSNLPFM